MLWAPSLVSPRSSWNSNWHFTSSPVSSSASALCRNLASHFHPHPVAAESNLTWCHSATEPSADNWELLAVCVRKTQQRPIYPCRCLSNSTLNRISAEFRQFGHPLSTSSLLHHSLPTSWNQHQTYLVPRPSNCFCSVNSDRHFHS